MSDSATPLPETMPDPPSSPGCGPPAASSPRTRRDCSSRPPARASWTPWSSAAPPASRWSTSSAGPSSAACGSPSTPACSCPAAVPSSWSRRPPPWPRDRRGAGRRRPVLRLGSGRRRAGRGPAGGLELHAADLDPAAVACARRNSPRPAARSTRATSSTRCPPTCAAGSTCWPPTCPTCPAARSACCRPRPATTRPLIALDGGPRRPGRAAPGRRRAADLARARRLRCW